MFIQEPFNLTGGVAGGGDAGYSVDYSCRYNDNDSPKLDRTQAAGTGKKQTIGGWFKLGSALATTRRIVETGVDGAGTGQITLGLNAADTLVVYLANAANVERANTTSLMAFRDPHAWYHLCVSYDTTLASPTFKVFVNNVEIALAASPTIAQNDEFGLNSISTPITIGAYPPSGGINFDGYFSQWFCLDGTTVATPADGGIVEVDDNGVVRPADLTGLTFGTQGWFLDFADSSNLGNDVSGNNNDFTSSGLAADDQVTDTPTNNHMTWTPLMNGTLATLSNGNLQIDHTTADVPAYSSWSFISGKWYLEVEATTFSTGDWIGVCSGTYPGGKTGLQDDIAADAQCWVYKLSTGYKSNGNGDPGVSYGSGAAAGNKIGIAIDMDQGAGSNKIWISVEGTFEASGDPDGDANAMYTNLPDEVFIVQQSRSSSAGKFIMNCGQLGALATTNLTGFNAPSTTTIPVPTIAGPSAQFQPNTRTGDGSAGAVTQTGNSQFGTDLILIKNRDQADQWMLLDRIRAATKELNTDSDAAESTDANGVTAFSATDGYTIGTGAGGYNDNTEKFIDYHWRADGSTGASNTEGSNITSTIAVNDTAGFSYGTYTGTGNGGDSFGHGITGTPEFVIVKQLTDASTNWIVYHEGQNATPEDYYLRLNTNDVPADLNTMWNDTAPSSTTVTLGTNAEVNGDGKNFVFYAFRSILDFSSFGSYEGNNATNGTLITLDFAPALVVCKNIDTTSGGNWWTVDGARDTYNPADKELLIDTTSAEDYDMSAAMLDFLSNGFKMRCSGGGSPNSSHTFVYMAWAEKPFGGHGGTFGNGVSPTTAR